MNSRRQHKSFLNKIFARGTLSSPADLYIESTEPKPRKSTSSEGNTSPTRGETVEQFFATRVMHGKSSTLPKSYRSAATLPLPVPTPPPMAEPQRRPKQPPALPPPYGTTRADDGRNPPRRTQSMKPISASVCHEYSRPFSWLLSDDEEDDAVAWSSVSKLDTEACRRNVHPDQQPGKEKITRACYFIRLV